MWYVIDTASKQVIAASCYEPDKADMAARGEIAIEAQAMPIEEVVPEERGGTWSVRREPRRYERGNYVRDNVKLDALVTWAKSLGFVPPWEPR